MRIIFANLPQYRGGYIESDECCWKVQKGAVLPSTILLCASEAKRAGHDVRYVDLAIDPMEKIDDCDLIVHPLPAMFKGCVTAMQRYKPVRIGIANPPGCAGDLSNLPGIFAAVYSEPEAVMRGLPGNASGLAAWRKIVDGIAVDGHIKPMLAAQFDRVGPTDYSLVPSGYWRHYSAAIIQATRGCPYRCAFCVWGGSTVTDRTYKLREAEAVAQDVSFVGKVGKPIYVLSSQLTTNRRWARDFAAAVEPGVTFGSNFNLREIDPDIIETLRGAGMNRWSAGLEATSDELLQALGKPHTMASAMAGIKIIEEAGMSYGIHILMGYGETEDQVNEAARGLEATGMTRAHVNITQLFAVPGTEMHDRLKHKLSPHLNYPAFGALRDVPIKAWHKYFERVAAMGLSKRRSLSNIPIQVWRS